MKKKVTLEQAGPNSLLLSKQGSSHGQRGASLVEYSLLVALIAAVSLGAVQSLGVHTKTKFGEINDAIKSGPITTAD